MMTRAPRQLSRRQNKEGSELRSENNSIVGILDIANLRKRDDIHGSDKVRRSKRLADKATTRAQRRYQLGTKEQSETERKEMEKY